MKVRPRKIDNKDKIKYLDALYTAVSTLKSRDEVKSLLKELLTESERIMIGRRILIAQMLLQDRTYDEIRSKMGVGVDTITKVHRWLGDENNGYEKAIKELEKILETRNQKFKDNLNDSSAPYSFRWLKKRYPLHFLLFNLFDSKR